MKTNVTIALVLALAATAASIVVLRMKSQPPSAEPLGTTLASVPPNPVPEPVIPEPVSPRPIAVTESVPPVDTSELVEQSPASTNKLERLAKIREAFRALAAGDRATAMRTARQITDETERETALLTLVTEWTQGELSPPRNRARLIGLYGVEAGLGFELAKDPQLALLWANELTEGPARVDLLQQVARGLIGSDPAAAFALGQQVSEEYRRKFSDALFADWASRDTAAAMQWANQSPERSERDAAIEAIRSVAPVGIGAALTVQDGYPVIRELIPGTPAQLSGQIGPGDRIIALAQGNSAFVDALDVPLVDIVNMVRGAPGTLLKLRVLPADAPPNSAPRTVSIVRDQINFKR